MSKVDEENISLDEMMERLKRSKRKESAKEAVGEMVIREDGSKMMKVKRRKRRSEQRVYEERKKKKRAQLVLFLGTFVLFLTSVGLFGFVFIRYNSGAFTNDLKKQILQASGSEVDFVNLSVTPLSGSAQSMAFKWSEDSILKEAKVKAVKTDIDTVKLIAGKLTSDEVFAPSGSVVLQLPKAQASLDLTEAEKVSVLNIPRLRIKNLVVRAAGSFGKQFFLSDSEMGIKAKSEGLSTWFKDGNLQLGSFGTWELNRASVSISGPSVRVEYLEANLDGADTQIRLEDREVVFTEDSVSVGMDVSNLPLEMVFGELFSEVVGGVVDAKNLILTIKKDDVENMDMRADFSSGEIRLSRLPMFSTIHAILENSPKASGLIRPTFTANVSGEFSIKNRNITVQFEDLNRPDQLAIKGKIEAVSGGQLVGELQIGIPSRFVELIESQRAKEAFSLDSKGYRWVSSKIGGTIASPDDDLYDSLIQGGRAQLAPSNESLNLEDTFEDLLR